MKELTFRVDASLWIQKILLLLQCSDCAVHCSRSHAVVIMVMLQECDTPSY